tara:strand:- start:17003 stop:18268 length:1266 start_codon:yes stop_codon:yes gene_type:complete
MNRVTNFFLVFVLAFAITNFYSRDINNEISKDEIVTNTTVYKSNTALEISKIIKTFESDNVSKNINKDEQMYSAKLISDLNDELIVLNQEITFLIKKQKFSKYKETHGGIRGIYVNGYHMTNESKLENILNIVDKTNVNSLVIDVKTDNGHILFNTTNTISEEMSNIRSKYDQETLRKLKDKNDLYLIGRVVVFQDPLFAKSYPDEAVFDSYKKRIYSQNDQYFVDPGSEKARSYVIDIAKEACQLGFDEIQFDYIRYPDSNYQYMTFKEENNFENRIKNINTFLMKAKEEINGIGCFVSADVFGFILTNKFDGGIGQNLETIIENVDFLSPMVYPSHYSKGSFGYQNPNRNPYGVITSALDDALNRGVQEVKLRPFLQGFWHSDFEVQENIRAAEDKNLDWIVWNVSSSYNLEYFTKLDS